MSVLCLGVQGTRKALLQAFELRSSVIASQAHATLPGSLVQGLGGWRSNATRIQRSKRQFAVASDPESLHAVDKAIPSIAPDLQATSIRGLQLNPLT